MLAGIKKAKGKYISIMDADLQHTPEFMIEMYNKLLENSEYDIICAYRENRLNESSLKRTLTAAFYKLNNTLSYNKLLPGASDFRVFKEKVKDALVKVQEKSNFLKGAFSYIGFNTIYVPYTPDKRQKGTSTWSLIKLIKYSISGMISFSNMPLKLMFILCMLLFLISFINFILLGNLAFRTIILLLGFLLLGLGVLALYISKMYSKMQNYPLYIVKEEIGFDEKTTK